MKPLFSLLALVALSAQAAPYKYSRGNVVQPVTIDAGLGLPQDPNYVSFVVDVEKKTLELGFSWKEKVADPNAWGHARFEAPITNETVTYCGTKILEAQAIEGDMVTEIMLVDTTASKCDEGFSAPVTVALSVYKKDQRETRLNATFKTNGLLPALIPGI